MIKLLSLCSMVLVGCVVDAESVEEYNDATIVNNEPEHPGWANPSGPPHNLGCPGEALKMPDGSEMILPGLCAPFYIYMGYPDPTEGEEEPFDGEKQFNNKIEEQ